MGSGGSGGGDEDAPFVDALLSLEDDGAKVCIELLLEAPKFGWYNLLIYVLL